MHVDVAIVGAGPAGCWAARRLALGGARVALIDGSHPREKPCGGGVTGRALALVQGAIDPQLDAVAIESATFEFGARTARVAMRDSGVAARLIVISRRAFDGCLLSAATRAGARLVPVRATAIRRRDDRWIVATRDGIEVAADWLLGADGPASLVRRSVSRRFDRQDLSIATGYFVRGVTSREIGIAFEHDPSGYLWSFPRADHLAIGVCAQAHEASPAVLLPVAERWIERHGNGHLRLERYSWPIPSLGLGALQRERPAGRGWLLLGDAAGMVDPITREGIYFALRSAEAAADSLASGGDVSGRYERAVQETIFAELVRAARLKARFFQPRFSALLLTALEQSSRIRAIMADLVSGDQPYHGLRRRLIATLELQLMFKVLRA